MKNKLTKRKSKWIFILPTLLIVGTGIGALAWQVNQDQQMIPKTSHSSLINQDLLAELSETSTDINLTHLGEGVVPPTNKWFSGFALQEEPKPGFGYPNSLKPTSDGFELGLPTVEATPTSILGVHAADIVVKVQDATNYKITDYDELMVELTYYGAADEKLVTVRLASGLPYVYISAEQDVEINFNGTTSPSGDWTSIQSNDTYYGVNVSSENNNFLLAKGSHASFFSAPNRQALEKVAAHANAILKSTSVNYKRQGDNFLTTLTYHTLQNQPLLFARLPHQQNDSKSEVTYQSILGDLTTEVGRELSFSTPAVPVVDTLDLSDISDEQRQLLTSQLRRDIASFKPKNDTYFGSKQLYRMAQLLTIAKQLEAADQVEVAKTALKTELENWLKAGQSEPKSFLYDPTMRGIVGNEPSFGSHEEFNDHHFHYGYFIYAAAILAKYDENFLKEYEDGVNLLVADISNYNADEKLPLRRSFDPYVGHSWASGIAPFADGNNQESTSEAINAWVGVSLWAKQTKNELLKKQADWMLSQEYRTAQLYWLLEQPDTLGYLSAYTSPIVSIVWGGKREYTTFFSDEPNAKLAIQLLPLSPTIKRLHQTLLSRIFEGTSTDEIYGDYILMATPDATLEQAKELPDSSIDDGNSRTYLYAYILSK